MNKADKDGWNPSSVAAEGGFVDEVEVLACLSVDINKATDESS